VLASSVIRGVFIPKLLEEETETLLFNQNNLEDEMRAIYQGKIKIMKKNNRSKRKFQEKLFQAEKWQHTTKSMDGFFMDVLIFRKIL